MILKKHFNNGRLILALCDKNLLNKTFEDRLGYLNMASNFYKGEEITEKEILTLLDNVYIINAVGKTTVNLLIRKGIVSENQIKFIKKIPYIQVVFDDRK